jgi:hypothetical protein
MISRTALIASVSRYLSDQEQGFEFEHWSQEDLGDYYRKAALMLASSDAYKDYFSTRTEVPLKLGRRQQLPEACDKLTNRYVEDEEGNTVAEVNTKAAIKFKIPLCYDGDATVTGFSYDPAEPTSITVDPPVTELGHSIFVNCFNFDADAEDIPLPAIAEPIIFELMLYYAFGTEIESGPSKERSALHFTNGISMLNFEIQKSAAKKRGK